MKLVPYGEPISDGKSEVETMDAGGSNGTLAGRPSQRMEDPPIRASIRAI